MKPKIIDFTIIDIPEPEVSFQTQMSQQRPVDYRLLSNKP